MTIMATLRFVTSGLVFARVFGRFGAQGWGMVRQGWAGQYVRAETWNTRVYLVSGLIFQCGVSSGFSDMFRILIVARAFETAQRNSF